MSENETKTRKQKAPSLLKSRKEKIGKDKQLNPTWTYAELAAKHNVTEDQARRAVTQFENGELDRKRYRQPVAKIQKIVSEKNVADIIDEQLHYSAAALQAATYYSPDERILALNKLVGTKGMIAKQKLGEHLRSADADFIAFLYRKFKRPDLTDEEIIQEYHKDYERWKSNNSTAE